MSELIDELESLARDLDRGPHVQLVLTADYRGTKLKVLRSAISRLREASRGGEGLRATVYVVEEDEGRIWLRVGGFEASARIDSPMCQALQRLEAELRAPPPDKDACDLTTPYVPRAIHYPQADTLEFVRRDVPVFTRPVHGGLDALLTVDTREPIGWRIYGWSKIAPPPDKDGQSLTVEENALHDMLTAAYEAGCLAVHENYQPDPNPEFGEAAWDYASSICGKFRTGLQPLGGGDE